MTEISPHGTVIVVTHGTALSTYLGLEGVVDAADFWTALRMPDAWLLDRDGLARLSTPSNPE